MTLNDLAYSWGLTLGVMVGAVVIAALLYLIFAFLFYGVALRVLRSVRRDRAEETSS